ncbi:MAG: nucleotidyltransferase family protein [Lachnospiraceae bacterium]|nr:nucleotidyltransferase family protein [Lachnospiraceae bacterium]MCC8153331.1 nucleotidyltransferase family protein [Tannerellaceae bacterium]
MIKTENLILQLTSRALFNTPVDFNPATTEWSNIYKEALSQALTLLIWDTLTDKERMSVPENIAAIWEQNAMIHVMNNEQLLYGQVEIFKLLDDVNIPAVIMKGSSSAVNYPNPSLRIMGDIDLLVAPEQQKKTVELLQANGYGEANGEDFSTHISVSKDRITVEIHKEPSGLGINEDKVIKKKLEEFFSDALEKRQRIGGLPFLSDEHQALVLILHKLKHFLHNELGLRQLCDWAVFVDKKLDDKMWEELRPRLEEFGLLTFTGIMTRACVDYLGLPEEKAPWNKDFDKELTDEVVEQILESGNFGSKAGTYGILYFTDVNSSNRLTSFVKTIFDRCKYHWPVCAKHPILMPVAPFVAYAKYLKLRKEGKRAEIKPFSLYRKAGAKQKLYKELKPFVVE